MMERLESFDSSDLMEFITAPQVKLVGTGGAGNNILDRLYSRRVKGVETIALNTDANHLHKSKAHVRKVIGAKITQGRGLVEIRIRVKDALRMTKSPSEVS